MSRTARFVYYLNKHTRVVLPPKTENTRLPSPRFIYLLFRFYIFARRGADECHVVTRDTADSRAPARLRGCVRVHGTPRFFNVIYRPGRVPYSARGTHTHLVRLHRDSAGCRHTGDLEVRSSRINRISYAPPPRGRVFCACRITPSPRTE